ncbi:MAG: GST-like protein [Alphaproteobacteria bacterium]|nr:GST-like protein [Alphaproteobacteria bacterium]
MTILPITLTIAGAAVLLNLWIAIRVAVLRGRHKIMFGDGGNPALTARMRAQSNFIEYTPLFLILLALVELARGPSLWLWIAGIVFILARLVHVFGMDRPAPNPLRAGGMALTFLPLLGLAIYAISVTYADQRHHSSLNYAAQDPALSAAATE